MYRKKKEKQKRPRGTDSNRVKNLNRYNRLKFKLDANSLLKFRSLEGTRTVPSPVVTEMITALFNRNFDVDMDEALVRKFAVQLLCMLGIIAIFNSDRRVCIDRVFELFAYPHKIDDKEANRYVFSIRTKTKPQHLVSYLYQLLFEGEEENVEESVDMSVYLNSILTGYFEGLYNDSANRLNELS